MTVTEKIVVYTFFERRLPARWAVGEYEKRQQNPIKLKTRPDNGTTQAISLSDLFFWIAFTVLTKYRSVHTATGSACAEAGAS